MPPNRPHATHRVPSANGSPRAPGRASARGSAESRVPRAESADRDVPSRLRSSPRRSSRPLSLALLAWAACEPASELEPPYPTSDVVGSLELDWSTHRREAPGSDNWPLTWGADDRQYTSWGDGGGFGGTDQQGRASLGFAVVQGDRKGYTGTNVHGGVGGGAAAFDGKSYGMLALADTLYAWVSPGSNARNYESASLLRSLDGGVTWDSTGVTFEGGVDGVVLPAILNFGAGYQGARDDFVYHYMIELMDATELAVQRPGRVHLARSPRGEMSRRSAYEWFAGLGADSTALWSLDDSGRVAVFHDPNGVGWNLSVSWNAAARRYLLATEHGETGVSNLGIFEAPEPWGPWRTVHYESGWGSHAIQRSVFYWNFANRWLSGDGAEFVLVFSGFGENDSWNSVEGRFRLHLRDDGEP